MPTRDFFPRLKTKKEFQDWLEQLQKDKEWFLGQLSDDERQHLDGSVEGMRWLGYWLANRYSSLKEAYNPQGIRLLQGAGRYVADVFMEKLGGNWTVELNDRKYVFEGYPGIKNFADYKSEGHKVFAQFWVTAAIGRPDPDFIAEMFRKRLERADLI